MAAHVKLLLSIYACDPEEGSEAAGAEAITLVRVGSARHRELLVLGGARVVTAGMQNPRSEGNDRDNLGRRTPSRRAV
jgi:hypothetical protein